MSFETARPCGDAPGLSVTDLAELVRVHGRRLHNFIRRRVGNVADVEDLVQETCLEAMRCLDRYQGHSRPETWLFGIALNLVRSHYKRARTAPVFDDEEERAEESSGSGVDPASIVENRERLVRLRLAVDRMPEASVAILVMVFDLQLTYEQVAAELSIPIGTVRSRIARARCALKELDRI